ncbi:uncharacterized protein LOC144606565 [Rhinoraja longicauda]
MNSEVRLLLKARDTAFRSGEARAYSSSRANLKRGIKKAKHSYKLKIEEHFKNSDSRRVWQGIQAITDYKPTNSIPTPSDASFLEELNHFYGRFDRDNQEVAIKAVLPADHQHLTLTPTVDNRRPPAGVLRRSVNCGRPGPNELTVVHLHRVASEMPREERLPTAGTVLCEGAAEPSSTMNPGHLEDGEVGEYCALLGLFWFNMFSTKCQACSQCTPLRPRKVPWQSSEQRSIDEDRFVDPWPSSSKVTNQHLGLTDIESKVVVWHHSIRRSIFLLYSDSSLPVIHPTTMVSSVNLKMELELCLTTRSWV